MACSNAVSGGSVSMGVRSVSLNDCLKGGKTKENGAMAAIATPSCAMAIRASPNAAMTSTATSPSRERGGCELILQGNWSSRGEGSWGLMRSSRSSHHRLHERRQPHDDNNKRGVWRMEMASDPLNNCRDSFGNECAVEKRARKELEVSEPYREVVNEIKMLKNRLAEAVAQQRFEEAAPLRDYIETMELRKRVLEISAKPRTAYRVGDVIVHRRYGYRGVIYGHDPECSAPEDWQEATRIDMLNEGRNQPFYHVLVDSRDRPGVMSTYVAQENIVLERNASPLLHPWIKKFFVGFQDGQYMPGSKLRQVYPNDW
eukprot:TRINITY_DN811_c0_g3_i3.p1 TRINITY_DN811_c0_g3~~TRINITY_DN811_c0_g3_i3.p1  ORF type:complete len:323 (-),score=39.05 TRINITY_DN811_c0_g3_i3:426-1370(-)